jgi:DNA-binding beta-propeller fold protein YncE
MAVKRRTFSRHHVLVRLHILALMLPALCGGCQSPQAELLSRTATPLVWPKPPEKPRIRYLGAISTEADLKRHVPWTEGLGNLLFGRKKIGVLVSPYAVAVDQAGRLFVTDTAAAVVHVFDLRMRRYKQFADLAGQEKLRKPVGLALAGNRIYVVDSVLRKVCVFDRDGRFIFSFGSDRLGRPSGIACRQDNGTVYVADTARHTIDVFTRDGKFVRQIGSRGVMPGTFNFPTHLWLDARGNLYVSDTLNYRIQVFSPDGNFLMTFGRQGDRPGNFAHPCGVATDTFGNIYVTDRQFENVQIFDAQGHVLMAFGEEGTQPGQFWLPAGIFIDSRNRIYVADSFNKRVQVFELLE